MGTQRKIFLALLVYVVLALIAGVIASYIYQKQEKLIISYTLDQLELRAHAIIKDQEDNVYQIVNDYTYWDEFVEFVKNPTEEWGEINVTSMLTSFDFESVWVIGIDGQTIYSASANNKNSTSMIMLDEDLLRELYAKRSINYYVYSDSSLLMIQGATIHPSNDPNKQTNPAGFLFTVKRWDAGLLHAMENISGCKLSIFKQLTSTIPEKSANTIRSFHAVENWKNEESGYVVFDSELTLITLLKNTTLQMQFLLVVSVIGFLISLAFLLSRLVNRPLRIVSEVIENEDLTKIPLLEKTSTDFARIGQLIEQFLKQKVDLVHAMQMAKASDQIKTDFLNNISHEVRTPLNGILGASSLLSDPEISPEIREEMVSIMNESTQRLMRTITQYMDISLLSSDNMPYYPIETKINEFFIPILDEYDAACKLKNLHWIVQFPAEYNQIKVFIDKTLFEKILHHLLDNAIKFTHNGSIIFGFVIKQSILEFFIKDTGIGIDKKVQPMIFKNFSQEDASNLRRYEGSGLGLAICKKASQLLGGNIWFESEKGRGTNFYFSIPFDNLQILAEQNKKVDELLKIKSEKPCVLIAEDDDSNYIMLSTIIHKYFKINIIRAFTGLEAVEYCNQNPLPDLILMDIKMPIMDGYEATRIIKKRFPNLHIIAVTALGMSGDELHSLEAGCDDYISKPINTKNLLSKLEKFFDYFKPVN
jgi:signal transduction histidine kinase/ActR/RegA family two-component response regulator